ncbi:MAG: hypothetical protein RIQ89_1705 [Bacteroidota bacterium]|jgi:uncharacterized protein
MNHPFAIVTGASQGIGAAIAIELAQRGFSLLLIARSETKLLAVKNDLSKFQIQAFTLALDLTQPNAMSKITEFIQENQITPTVLVNNAGYGLWGTFENLPLSAQENMMHLNMVVPVKITHALLPILKQQPQAYILNVASTAAYQAVPTLSIYAATKSFMLVFSRGLRKELADSNVSVTTLSPGATKTGFMDRAGMKHPLLVKRANQFSMSMEAVAAFGVKSMLTKKNEVIPGWINKISVAMTYWVPKALTEKIAANLYKI